MFLIDVSLKGFRVAHQEPLRVQESDIEFDWRGDRVVASCAVVRTRAHRPDESSPRLIYHSGLELITDPPAALRELVAWHVARALDEQKANARGIPPEAPQSVQTGGGNRFVRHEHIGGLWRHLPTNDPKQPRTGFTVSASATEDEVAMLRETFEFGDDASRRLLRQLAELSISNPDGIPTRRYEP